jgi:hypothetical protein
MSGGGFSITISAVDKASSTLEAVNKRLQKFNAPVDRLRKNLGKFSDLSGLSKLGGTLSGLARKSLEVFQAMSRIIEPLGAITGALTVAGMYKLASSWSNFGNQLWFAAYRTGTTAKELYGLQSAAELAGASGESMTSGLRNLTDALTDAAGGRAPEVVQLFNLLGVQFENMPGKARRATDVLPELADKIAAIKEPAIQAQLATRLFGAAGEDLLRVFMGGSAGLAEYVQKAMALSRVTDKNVDAARRLHEAQAKIGIAATGLGAAIAERLEPVLTPLLEKLASWIANNRSLEETMGRFAAWIAGVKWEKVGDGISGVATSIENVVKFFGDWSTAAEYLLAFMVGKWAIGMGAAIAEVVAKYVAMMELMGLTGGATGGGVAAAGGALLAGGTLATILALRGDTADPSTFTPAERASAALAQQADREAWERMHPKGAAGAMAFFQSRGWSAAQSAGLAANIQAESGFNAGAVGDYGHAYGIAQWHPDRQAAFERWAGRSIKGSSYESQLAFMDYELKHGEAFAGWQLRQAKDPAAAAGIVSRLYERPAASDAEAASRGALAQSISVAGGAPVQVGGSSSGGDPIARIKVDVDHRNAPPGTKVTVTSPDDRVDMGATRISRPMPDYISP